MTGSPFSMNQQLTSVRLCSTANLSSVYFNGPLNDGVGATLTSSSLGALSLDGVLVNVNDRVFVKDQTNGLENGIYDVLAIGSAVSLWKLKRSPDFQSIEQIKVGQYFGVGAGDTFAGSWFIIVEPLPTAIGSGAVTFFDVSTNSGGGPFLKIANNLSDVANKQDSFSNIGLGSGDAILLTDADFSGGIHTLSNPCPNYINIACNTPGNSLYLPSAFSGDPDSFALSQGPYINILPSFQSIELFTAGGNLISTLPSPSNTHAVSTSDSSDDGSWALFNYVNTINGVSGRTQLVAGSNISISQSNGDITIAATSGPSAVTSGQASYFRNSNATQTTFSGPNAPTPILTDGVNVLFENNFTVAQSGGSPTAQFLTAATRRILVNAVFSVFPAGVLTQSYSLYILINHGSSTTLTNILSNVTVAPAVLNAIPVSTNIALTGPADSIQFWISNNSGTANPVTVVNFSAALLDTTQFGGFTSTDVLPQGTNNLYLSQDGGSTYQNVTGLPVVSGNIAVFNSTGGQLHDVGLQAGQANSVNTLQTNTNISFFPTFVSSTTNSYQQIRVSTGWSINPSTNVMSMAGLNLSGLTASQIVGTDGSKNLVSLPNYGTTAKVTVTASTQAMAASTRYINNYSGGQCVFTLPAATGSGALIILVSYPPATTSGWRVNTTGTDKIQFMSSLSAAGGNIVSTAGSATDCATFSDDASGLWVVYPAGGLNLVVT